MVKDDRECKHVVENRSTKHACNYNLNLGDRGSSNEMVSCTIVTDRQRFAFGDFYLANSCGMLLFSSLYVPCTKRMRYKNIMHNILRSTAKIFNMITLYSHFISL